MNMLDMRILAVIRLPFPRLVGLAVPVLASDRPADRKAEDDVANPRIAATDQQVCELAGVDTLRWIMGCIEGVGVALVGWFATRLMIRGWILRGVLLTRTDTV